MAKLKFLKVATMPGSLVADAFYFVENGTYAESYVTDDAGVAHAIGNTAMINSLISSALSSSNALEVVADITARDALSLVSNTIVLVEDASADATVASGAALYIYKASNTTFSKIAEYESLDITLSWSLIQGRPASTPADIDDAVSKRHAHANIATLNKFSEDGDGDASYDGNAVMKWTTTNW